jgi:hypothetical protein
MKTDSHEFWTFLVKGLSIDAVSGLLVTGWFMFAKINQEIDEEGGGDINMRTHYLTPNHEPVTLQLPAHVLGETHVSKISCDQITGFLETMFKMPFQKIPKAPTDLPLHRVPPARREIIKSAIEGTK